jgi:hypothetical protein
MRFPPRKPVECGPRSMEHSALWCACTWGPEPICARIPWVPLDNMPLGCNGYALLCARLAAIEDIKRLGRQPL